MKARFDYFLIIILVLNHFLVSGQCTKGFKVHLNSSSNVFGTNIIADRKGDVYLSGYFQNTLAVGTFNLTSAGNHDILIAKYDSTGKALWAKRNGGGTNDFAMAMALSGDSNLLVAGRLGSNSTITNYDKNGTSKWTITGSGTGSSSIEGISSDNSGNFYVTGNFQTGAVISGNTLTSAGLSDAFIAKYDLSGNLIWLHTYGGSSNDYNFSIHYDTINDVLYSGISFNNSIIINGQTYSSVGDEDYILMKLDSDGNFLKTRHGGGGNYDRINKFRTDSDGNVYTAGSFVLQTVIDSEILTHSEYMGMFVVKYDADFNFIWAKAPFLKGNIYLTDFYCSKNKDLFITGSFTGQGNSFEGIPISCSGGDDIFIAKYDSNGNTILIKSAGGPNTDTGYGVFVNNKEEIFLTSRYINNAKIFGHSFASGHFNSSTALFKLNRNGFSGSSFSAGTDINQPVCKDSATIGQVMETSYNYTWSPTTGLADADTFITKAKPMVTTEYILTINTGNCIYKDTVNFVTYELALPSDSLKVDGSLIYCSDKPNPTLTAFPDGTDIVTWYYQNNFFSNNSFIQAFNTGVYYAKVSNLCGNSYTDTVNVIRNIIPASQNIVVTNSKNKQFINANSNMNYGDYTEFSYTPLAGMNYAWNTGYTGDTLTAAVSGTYYFTITDIHGCKNISPQVSVTTSYTPWAIIQTTNDQNGNIFYREDFINADTGYVISMETVALKTTDGGYHWEDMNLPVIGYNLSDVHFFDYLNGIVLGEKGYFITANGGASWTYTSLSPVTGTSTWAFKDLEFHDRNTGYIVGYPGIVYKTTDGGLTWNQKANNGPGIMDDYYAVSVLGADQLIYGGNCLNGYNGYVAARIDKSLDGGNTYSTKYFSWPSQSSGWIYDIDFPSSLTGYAVDQPGGLMKTSNAGESWNYVSIPSSEILYNACLINDNEGYVGGANGFISRTNDGGSSWTNESSYNHGYIFDLDFPTPQTGYGIGHYGTIIKRGEYKLFGFITNNDNKPFDSCEVRLLKYNQNTNSYQIEGVVYTNKVGYYEFSENIPQSFIQIIPNPKYYPVLPPIFYPDASTIETAQAINLLKGYNEYNFVIGYNLVTGTINTKSRENSISLYPNPASQSFFLKSSSMEIDRVQIFNIVGDLIYEVQIDNSNDMIEIITETFSSGLYYIHVRSGISSVVKPMVIIK